MMTETRMLVLILGLTATLTLLLILSVLIFYFLRRPKLGEDVQSGDVENVDPKIQAEVENLLIFKGGEDLTIIDILDAPGEVIGKSCYGTLYRALMQSGSSNLRLLRFLRPLCAAKTEELVNVVELLGGIRHRNLVPLVGFYSGPRGEKLLIYPFYRRGNLANFIRDGADKSNRWALIYKISIGVARGLDHLHTGMPKPVIHGNLKLKNIFLDRHHEPRISDFGLHLLLNATAGQEMLEAAEEHGYRAPELIKMKDVNGCSDIYNLGVILLELITGKEPRVNENEEELHLADYMRRAVLGPNKISQLCHPGMFSSDDGDGADSAWKSEDRVLRLFQLAIACCSPSPSLRPSIKQVLRKLEEIGQ